MNKRSNEVTLADYFNVQPILRKSLKDYLRNRQHQLYLRFNSFNKQIGWMPNKYTTTPAFVEVVQFIFNAKKIIEQFASQNCRFTNKGWVKGKKFICRINDQPLTDEILAEQIGAANSVLISCFLSKEDMQAEMNDEEERIKVFVQDLSTQFKTPIDRVEFVKRLLGYVQIIQRDEEDFRMRGIIATTYQQWLDKQNESIYRQVNTFEQAKTILSWWATQYPEAWTNYQDIIKRTYN